MSKGSVVSVNVNGSRSCVEETQANPDRLLVVLLTRISGVYYSARFSRKMKEDFQLERKALFAKFAHQDSGSGSVLVGCINGGT